MNKRLFVLLILTFILLNDSLFAKYEEKPPIVWNNFSTYELNLSVYEPDPSVSAVVLCDYGTVTITNRTIYTRIVRIKVLKDSGIQYATVELPYNPVNKHDEITMLKGHTIDIQNGKVVNSYALSKKNITEISKNGIPTKVLQFPNVHTGSIIEYQYEIASLDFVKLREWFFQSSIPVIWSESRFDVPSPFFYLLTYEKGVPLNEQEQNDFASELSWLYSNRDLNIKQQIVDNNYSIYETKDKRYKVYLINNIRKKIIYRDLPALSDNGLDHYQSVDNAPKLKIHLFKSQGMLPGYFKPLLASANEEFERMSPWQIYNSPQTDQSGYIHYLLESWDQFNSRLLSSKRLGIQLQHPIDCQNLLDSILTNKDSELQKVKDIYNYVSNSIEWAKKYSIYVDESLKKVFQNKTGSSGEKNLLLIYLLRRAGLTADPVLVRTANMGRVEQVYPVNNQFNHLICMITIEGQLYLLDALRPGTLDKEHPMYCKQGFLLKKEGFGWVDLYSGNSTEFAQKYISLDAF